MRWEVLTTKVDERQAAHNQTKRLESLLMWVYAMMLKIYPPAFRAAFADEMTDVFAMTLRETSGRTRLALILWREVCGLPMSLLAVHRQLYGQLPAKAQQRHQVRWFVRIIGGLLTLFLFSTLTIILSPSYNLYAQAVPFVGALFIATLSMLMGLCWGRVGGILTIASGAAIGCCMTLYIYVMAASQIGIVATVLIGLIWALPFLIFGILFYELSKPPKQHITPV